MRRFPLAALFFVVVTAAGCRSSALQKDQDRFRATILDSYTNQIMDNLIRTSNALPILQVDYTNITGTVTDAGSFGTAPTSTATSNTQLSFAALRVLTQRMTQRMIATTAAFTTNASRQQQLAVTGVPVIDKPEVYKAYLEFINKPGSLIRDCNEPPPGVAHIVRKVGDAYFYVPVEYKKEFFELALKTTVMRGEEKDDPEVFKATIANVAEVANTVSGLPANFHQLTLDLAEPIPNDSGTLKVVDGETPYILQIKRGTSVASNAPISKLAVAYNDRNIKLGVAEMTALLKKGPVEITLVNNRPKPVASDEILKSIFTQVQLNRLDNLRLVSPK